MSTKVGLWINHRKAVILAVTDQGEATRLIISKVDKLTLLGTDSMTFSGLYGYPTLIRQ
jgi:hypothetical protein